MRSSNPARFDDRDGTDGNARTRGSGNRSRHGGLRTSAVLSLSIGLVSIMALWQSSHHFDHHTRTANTRTMGTDVALSTSRGTAGAVTASQSATRTGSEQAHDSRNTTTAAAAATAPAAVVAASNAPSTNSSPPPPPAARNQQHRLHRLKHAHHVANLIDVLSEIAAAQTTAAAKPSNTKPTGTVTSATAATATSSTTANTTTTSTPAPPTKAPAAFMPLDSCRRCASFSASDFLPGAPDLLPLASEDPDWRLGLPRELRERVEAAGAAGTGRGGAAADSSSSSRGGDIRRAECRKVGPFLGPVSSSDPELEAYHRRVVDYIRSPEYRARAASIASSGGRGILISAGGSRYLTNLIATLHVLRRHFRCGLPVEVAWQGSGEMDAATWASLERHFAPLRGVNVRGTPHPVRGLHGERFDATSYSGKVYALAVSRFREVLMLDADSLPLLDPTALFDDPRFVQYGSLFWPDAWTGLADRAVFDMYGMNGDRAESVLRLGRGAGRRDSESGQLLLDRSRHLDVLEALLLLNRHPDANKPLLWGDKDSFWLAFAAVGKAHCFGQVAVPPGAFMYWSPDKLLTKATGKHGPGWLLGGFVQNIEDVPYVYGSTTTPSKTITQKRLKSAGVHANSSSDVANNNNEEEEVDGPGRLPSAPAPRAVRPAGASLADLVPLRGLVRPAFLHRTINKLRQGEEPRLLELLTAPMTQRWAGYFLAHDNPGPTRGVPWDYCVPDSSLRILTTTQHDTTTPASNHSHPHKHHHKHKHRQHASLAASLVGTSPQSGTTNARNSTSVHRSRLGWNVSAPAQLPPTTDQWLAKARREWRQRAAAAGGRRRRGSKEDEIGLVWAWGDEEAFTEWASASASGNGWLGRWRGSKGDRHPPSGDRGGTAGGVVAGLGGGNGTTRESVTDKDDMGPCPLAPSLTAEGADGCPVEEMEAYLQALDAGVPLDRHPALERLCAQQLRRAAGAAGQRAEGAAEAAARRRGLGAATAATDAYRAAKADGSADWVVLPRSSVGPYAYLDTENGRGGDVGALGGVPPPLPAVRYDWEQPWPCGETPFMAAVRASYRAYGWVQRHRREFPMLGKS